MITIDKYLDGFYVKGHSFQALCSCISYSCYSFMWILEDLEIDLQHYTSAEHNDYTEGITWIKFNNVDKSKIWFDKWLNDIKWLKSKFNKEIELAEHNKKIFIKKGMQGKHYVKKGE